LILNVRRPPLDCNTVTESRVRTSAWSCICLSKIAS
jgi:hypothetical protein